MWTYAIGDIQGCNQELVDLLDRINFDPAVDRLWMTGDIVNRGPESLKVLRLVRELKAVTVLGNHDLHLLAVAAGKVKMRKKDTLDEILAAPDREELIGWLMQQPLIHIDTGSGYTLVHAGLPPQWDIAMARKYSSEIENVLQGEKAAVFFEKMYGDKPDIWSDGLQGWDRLRFITNCFTRIRYCYEDGRIEMKEKGPPGSQSKSLKPWYEIRDRQSSNEKIIFGHWATVRLGIEQDFRSANVYALDTGCVWGGKLTAFRLEDGQYFEVPSRQGKRT